MSQAVGVDRPATGAGACGRPMRSRLQQLSFVRVARISALAIVLLATATSAFAANVTAVWDPNPEPNVSGYKLSYGTQSGVYTTTIDVGPVTSWPLTLTP